MQPEILLSNGQYLNFLDPDPEVITIEAIAHALARQCRFTGHTSRFYSVAEHSVRVSRLVPQEDALEGLLHDAAEAFIVDIPSPLKQLLPQYKEIEQRLERVIAEKFGLRHPWPDSVKHADLVMLKWERRDLLPKTDNRPWAILEGVEMPDEATGDISHSYGTDAEAVFLQRFHELAVNRIEDPMVRLKERAARIIEANFPDYHGERVAKIVRELA